MKQIDKNKKLLTQSSPSYPKHERQCAKYRKRKQSVSPWFIEEHMVEPTPR